MVLSHLYSHLNPSSPPLHITHYGKNTTLIFLPSFILFILGGVGKPSSRTYEIAEEMLHNQANHQFQFDHIYGIGDNPQSDIKFHSSTIIPSQLIIL